MNPLFCLKECLDRTIRCKRALIVFAALFVVMMICGIIFVDSPLTYGYHRSLCDRYIELALYSEKNVFLIFVERTAGHALLLVLLCLCGVHIACVFPSAAVIIYRAYTFGGSLNIFFSVYRFTGSMVVFILYLPVHLLIDALLLAAAAISFCRSRCFRFCKNDFKELACDFCVLFLLVAAVCFAEMLLLLALFHPLGSVI